MFYKGERLHSVCDGEGGGGCIDVHVCVCDGKGGSVLAMSACEKDEGREEGEGRKRWEKCL